MQETLKKETLKNELKSLPNSPGVYQYFDAAGKLLYVGKAKVLKNRVKSYFSFTPTLAPSPRLAPRIAKMIAEAVHIEWIETSSESDALILENSFIKQLRPKYNILLRDDKTYPYIELTKEKYPRLRVVRNVKRKKNLNYLYGPYPNVTAARKTVNMLNRLYPLRKCEHLKKELCLYYHIHECLGYCTKSIDKSVIDEMSKEIVAFLKGDSSFIREKINKEMLKASEVMNYERALELKTMLEDIDITLRRQKIDLNNNYNFDLINYYVDKNYLSIQVFFVRDGLLVGRNKDIISSDLDVLDQVVEYILKFYEKTGVLPKELLVPEEVDGELLANYLNIKVSSPKKGKLKNLLDLARDNAKEILMSEEEMLKKNDDLRLKAIDELKVLLKTDNVSRMEAFDNSHLFGTFYVGGMVVYNDFLPLKDEYRKYKISVTVKDDLGAMKEVLYRRYYRVLMENLTPPDIVVMDGGYNQVRIAKDIIDSLGLKIRVIGLVKNDKHKTSSIIDEEGRVLEVSPNSNLFLFFSRIQEEVHRYAITYHRNIKAKGSLSSLLDLVPGIGEVRRKELLKKFGSLKKMKEVSFEELNEVLPDDVSKALFDYLKEM